MTIKQLYEKLCSPEFQDTDNGSLAYNFYIYQYPAEKEYVMRENIVDFCDKLARPAVFIDVLAINLFKEFCAYLDSTPMGEGTVLTDSLDSEAEYPEDILNELKETARSSDFRTICRSCGISDRQRLPGRKHRRSAYRRPVSSPCPASR